MFTGIIEQIGTLTRVERKGNYVVLTVASGLANDNLRPGESVCCDGVCLTVIRLGRPEFVVEASQETAAHTIVNRYAVGRRINLERAVKADGRFGGHFVSGHVDGTGEVDYLTVVGDSLELAIRYDRRFDPVLVDKGSIAVNGVSLTVNRNSAGWFVVNLIPYTQGLTNLATLSPGDTVNLEFDIIGKYIMKQSGSVSRAGLTMEKLMESGW